MKGDASLPELYRWSLETLSRRPRPDWLRRYEALVAEHDGRAYHNWSHIESTLRTALDLIRLEGGVSETETAAIVFALFNHDRVYEPGRADNEELAAQAAREDGGDDEAGRLILLTKAHFADPHDLAGKIVVDADLSILAAERGEYGRYAVAIADEFGRLPKQEYRQGRIAFLRGMVRRAEEGSLFFTEHLDQALARQNMEWEIAQLEAGVLP
ncbi:MAG TPA: hypothetical protein VGE01_13855 [Fimbriimonas sp.]